MKKIFVLVVIMTAVLSLQALAVDDLIVPGQRIGWFTLGVSFTEMKKVIGEPESTENTSGGGIMYSYGSKYGMIVMVLKDRVILLSTINSRYYTPEGIKIGNSDDEAVKVFGNDYQLEKKENNESQITYWDKGITFFIRDKKIWMIGVHVLK